MTKDASIILIAAIAGIIIAGTIVVTMPAATFAENACSGGIAAHGKSGGIGVSGGINTGGSHNANGASDNGPGGSDASGPNDGQRGCNNSS